MSPAAREQAVPVQHDWNAGSRAELPVVFPMLAQACAGTKSVPVSPQSAEESEISLILMKEHGLAAPTDLGRTGYALLGRTETRT